MKKDNLNVDMVGLARETALREDSRDTIGAVKVIAPAKVNLFLGIGSRRPDGYHDADNTMHALMLHDVLYIRYAPYDATWPKDLGEDVPTEGPIIRINCYGREGVEAPGITSEQNIAYKAVRNLAAALGRTECEFLEIRIDKHIPHQAGLGGGSADAAAALVGAAMLWGVPADAPELEAVAQKLGADVAFFLHGGCTRLTGVGEEVDAKLATRKDSVVLIKPEGGLSTAAVYGHFDELAVPLDADLLTKAKAAECAADVPVYNNLAVAAEELMPLLKEIREWLLKQPGVTDAMLCGSGSCTFAVCQDFASASRVVAAAKQKEWWARATSFAPLKAAVAPRN